VHKRVKKAASGVEQRTVAVSLLLTTDQHSLFVQVVQRYNLMWKRVVQWCVETRTANRTAVQRELYHVLRAEFPDLPSQFTSIALRDGPAAVKSWNSRYPKRKWELNLTRRRLTLNYDLRVMSMRGNLLGLSTLHGEKRQRFLIDIPDWFTSRYPDGVLNAAKVVLHYDGTAKVCLIYRLTSRFVKPSGDVVGIDRGIKVLAYTSKGGEFGASRVAGVKRRYAHNRKMLQSKGTRSAKRRLKAMSGREKRFVSNVNHVIAKSLAEDSSVCAYVLEDLTEITSRKDKSARKAKKMMRTWLSNWSYFQLEQMIEYKCRRNGIAVFYVSPAYTSQRCNRCGFVDERNRNGSWFDCRRCGYSTDADYNAACNIRDKHISSTIGGGAGQLSTARMDGTAYSGSRPSRDPCGRGS
jgi:IS605 OrfB family transposase